MLLKRRPGGFLLGLNELHASPFHSNVVESGQRTTRRLRSESNDASGMAHAGAFSAVIFSQTPSRYFQKSVQKSRSVRPPNNQVVFELLSVATAKSDRGPGDL